MEQFVLSQSGTRRVALAAAHDNDALSSLMMAVDRKIAQAILIGHKDEICRLLVEMGKNPDDFQIIEESDDRAMVDKAVELVRNGQADLPMKGLMHTSTFMKGILDKETGLKEPGNLLSQASVFEIPEKDQLLIISDCAVNIQPDLEQKILITENAVKLAGTLGIEEPKIAVLSAVEVVNPKIQNTVDAREMRERLSDKYLIDGPLALDNAIDEAAAKHKGIDSPVAGKANILIVPDLWSGNIFTKGLVFFAHLRSAGTLNGLKTPVVMSSRTDTVENKYLSILTAVLQSIR
jgi:phosphate butyryltransferase